MLNAPFIIDDGKHDYRQLQQKVIFLSAEISKYKNKIMDYQENYHYSQLETLKIENLYLKEQIQKYQQNELKFKEEHSKAIAGYEMNQKELSSKEADCLSKIEKLNEQIRNSKRLNLSLQENNTSLFREIEEFNKNRVFLHKQLSEKESQLVQLKEENEQLILKNNDLKDIINSMKNELTIYSDQLAPYEQIIKKNQIKIDELQNDISLQKEELQKRLLEILEYRTLVSDYNQKIVQKEKIIKDLKIKEEKNMQLHLENEKLQALNSDLYNEKLILENIQKEIIAKLIIIRDEIKKFPNSPFNPDAISDSKLVGKNEKEIFDYLLKGE
ncbi:hypothetical protein [Cytobacillus pseudoceanisediminis]|uniref:hypothetical protein n=1 Tax=Cytobacillus pseudoceanisediminis TaxID=3051614 RepID=UPI003C2E2625